jgi:hypothetical protein
LEKEGLRALEGSWVFGKTDKSGCKTRENDFGENGKLCRSNEETHDGDEDHSAEHLGLVEAIARVAEVETTGSSRQNSTEKTSKTKNVRDEIVIDNGIDSTALDERPGVLASRAVVLSIDGDLRKGVVIKVLGKRLDHGHAAVQAVETKDGTHVSVVRRRLGSTSDNVAERLNEGNDERAIANGAKACREGSPGRLGSGVSDRDLVLSLASRVGNGHEVVRRKESGHGDMNDILDDLRNPVESKDLSIDDRKSECPRKDGMEKRQRLTKYTRRTIPPA